MAVIHLCDGCGKPAENPERVGVVVKREYCASCVVIAKEFLIAEDALRAELVANFAETRNRMIESASKDGFKLPDVL